MLAKLILEYSQYVKGCDMGLTSWEMAAVRHMGDLSAETCAQCAWTPATVIDGFLGRPPWKSGVKPLVPPWRLISYHPFRNPLCHSIIHVCLYQAQDSIKTCFTKFKWDSVPILTEHLPHTVLVQNSLHRRIPTGMWKWSDKFALDTTS